MLAYQRGRYWPDLVPAELKPALDQARAQMKEVGSCNAKVIGIGRQAVDNYLAARTYPTS
jgi:hypothetical protein